MSNDKPLMSPQRSIPEIRGDTPQDVSADVLATRDHDVIQRWAAVRHAEPATGEATSSGPATVAINDGGSGIRFNFPGTGRLRPISWSEWFENFDRYGLVFVYNNDALDARSTRYRIVKADDWSSIIR